MFDNVFETVNSGFAQALYEDFLRDPASVPEEWRTLFENGLKGESPAHAPPPPRAGPPATAPDESAGAGAPAAQPIKGAALRLLRNMESSLAVPTATSFRDIDVTHLWAERAGLNATLASRNLKLSFTHLVGWAMVHAIQEIPSMHHAVIDTDDGPEMLVPDSIDLGLAVDVERKDGSRGLLVPVIKNAGGMTFADFHAEYERLVAGARGGKLLPDAYQGATVTLTNPGTLGTVASVPRLMRGQGSIIATGAIRNVAGVRIMTVSSTYDHRIIQGADSGTFLRVLDRVLQGDDDWYGHIARALDVSEAGAPPPPAVAPQPTPQVAEGGLSAPEHIAAAMSLVKNHRTHGYLAARLDPLGTNPPGDPALDPEPLGLTRDVMAEITANVLRVYVAGDTLAEVLPLLQQTYCGTIAYEIEHIANHEERVWLRRVIEAGEHRVPLTGEEKRRLLSMLTEVDSLERFLHRAYLGAKRFGSEGVDLLIPMLEHALDLAADGGTSEVVLGMPHRGRLNVLTHLIGVPYETLLAEFEGGLHVEETLTPKGGTGDVKYHHGASGEFRTAGGKRITVSLLPNPSHLEAVDPVVEGRTRAVQTNRRGPRVSQNVDSALAILVHGDAAFAAQGVVAETFNLARLPGYGTGGTLHIIANNQVGFTTDPREARSTDYSSDLAKGFDVPIIHVNADDAEACLAAIRLALMYRQRFRGDCVIDLVGYRRHGHNEADEPRYTQPVMYQRIDEHPTARAIYADRLAQEGVIERQDAEKQAEDHQHHLAATQQKLRQELSSAAEGEEPVRISGAWTPIAEPETAVPEEAIRSLNHQLVTVPDGFTITPKLKRQLNKRLEALDGEPAIDWAHAEALAFAALLNEGIPLRLSGQDSERGTFSQRHLMLHDGQTGERYAPVEHLPGATAPFEMHNSPLSEYAVLGFEYGYSVAAPDTLVMWEAQFGDFANTAQVIVDQFVIAGLSKWGQTSRLALLLPHGYEGQGPEHSNARLERFLALGAEGNIRVANCSTPAQYFHLLRRQARHQEIRPLVIMTPKSLLRSPNALSSLTDLSDGMFHQVLDDPAPPAGPALVTRLVFCSGKVFYDVVKSRHRAQASHVAVARIELLYPFPKDDTIEVIRSYPGLREIVWLQEEPANLGGRKWVVPQLMAAAPAGVEVRFVSRPERSSPAEGYPAAHQREQERLVTESLR